MRAEVRRDREQSSADFTRAVWPILQQHCPELRGSTLQMVEGRDGNPIAADLDIEAGIDAYQRVALGSQGALFGLRGITSRVQWGKNHRTFTIRVARPNGALTEYLKRITILKRCTEGFFYPYWSIHAYLDQPGGRLLAVGVAKTLEIYLYVAQCKRNGRPCRELPAGNGGERFLCVEWESFRRAGYYLYVYTAPQQMTTERLL